MKKIAVVDMKTITEFRRLAAALENQSGIRLNAEKAVRAQNTETLKVWEKTLLQSERGWRRPEGVEPRS
jgi:hypothetical protein